MMIKVKKKRGSLSLCDINSCWCGSLLYVCPLLSELISLNLETKASFKWSRNRRRGSWWVPDFWVQPTHSRIWSRCPDWRVRSTAELPSRFSSLLLYICSILQRFRKLLKVGLLKCGSIWITYVCLYLQNIYLLCMETCHVLHYLRYPVCYRNFLNFIIINALYKFYCKKILLYLSV